MSDPRASTAVGQAIRQGKLPHPTALKCTDCGAIATSYDHYLGYAPEHWLDVQPVCDRHNGVRAWASREKEVSSSGFSAVLLRAPTWLLEELDRDAIECGRSRSSQIIWILRQRFPEAMAAHKDDVSTRARDPRRLREDEATYIWNVA
jgi:hypothetical protein